MAELLVRVVSKTNAVDPQKDAKLTKRGDVIVLFADNWPWQKEELKDPAWRLLRVQGIAPESLSVLLEAELDINPAQPSLVLQRRKARLDIDNLGFQAFVPVSWWNDASRSQPLFSTNIPLPVFNTFIVIKSPLVDSHVLGPP